MAYNQTPTSDNNNALYFIVGGLLVLALIIGAFVLNTNDAENAYEPAAGMETSAPATSGTTTNDVAPSVGTTTGSEAPADSTAPLAP